MFYSKIKDRAPEIILLGSTAFLQFYRLGIGEIQSWDEARYILRAEACVRYGAWLDQTQYAIAGLYSSTHPPLIVWMMACARMMIGNGVFASRIISAIAAVVVLIFFYKLTRKFFSRWNCLFTTVSLGCAQGFLWFSHHAQFDIPMLAFIVAAVYYAIWAFEEDSRKFAVLAGIMFGCALMSKAIQGLYLLPFVVALPYIYQQGHRFRNLALLLITTFVVALPWYIYMVISHLHFYGDYAELIGSLKAGTYAKEVTTQWWYYLNQIIINFPLLILAAVVIVPIAKKLKERDTEYSRMLVISFMWFIGMLVFLSCFQTRMPHFSLFLFLPASLAVGFIVEEFIYIPMKGIEEITSLLLILFALVWTSSELIRNSIRERYLTSLHLDYFMIIAILIVISMIVLLLTKKFRLPEQTIVLLMASLIIIGGDFYRWSSRNNKTFIDGAEQVGNVLLHSPGIHHITAYYEDYPHESYLPQLNYYTDCWFIGWNNDRTGDTKAWSECDSLIKEDNVPRSDAAIVYTAWDAFYKPRQEETDLLQRINRSLSMIYARAMHTKKYQMYWELKTK